MEATNYNQTITLIELGLTDSIREWRYNNNHIPANYRVDDLLELLPEKATKRIRYVATKRAWIVDVDVLGKSGAGKCYLGTYRARLVDALYDMIVKLKEEGVI
jgi:hypothetical protein